MNLKVNKQVGSQVLHKLQFEHLFSAMRLDFRILVLKADHVARSLSFLGNLDHKNGPRYLIECLPYFTVLNRGIKKSEFRRL